MNKTVSSQRIHIGIYGDTNVGKSSFINSIFKREISIVSEKSGTTTDSIYKNIEIDGLGPITFIDTAGFFDNTSLGELRMKKTQETLNVVDYAIYILDEKIDFDKFIEFKKSILKKNINSLLIINKADLIDDIYKQNISKELESKGIDYIFFSSKNNIGRDDTIEYLRKNIEYKKENMFRDIINPRKQILFVISIDSEYPDGRLILPQSQAIRDALGNGNFISVVREEELQSFLELNKSIDLVVTDSKIFKSVKEKVGNIKLTSFSILMANLKGDIDLFLDGIKKLESMQNQKNVRILIYESCNHTANHEDIGRVKIPNILKRFFVEKVEIDFASNKDIDIFEDYDLIIHCGSCMENKKSMISKLDICRERKIPIINYGVFLAYFANILDRAVEIF